MQEFSLRYVDPGTVTPPGPGDPDPDPIDPPTPDPVDGQVRVPKTWPGQVAWDQAVVEGRAATLNPWGCLDPTQIRADNGQCIEGGTSLTDADYVYVNSLADSGDSSTTPAPTPGPDPVTPPVTPDPDPVTPDPDDDDDDDDDDGDDGDDGDDDDGDDGDDEPVSENLSLNFDAEANSVEVTVGDGVSDVRYIVQDESGLCNEDNVSSDDATSLEGTSITVTEEDVEDGYVCVFATMTDEDGEDKLVFASQSLSGEADEDDDGKTDDGDEGGSSSLPWIIAVVVVLIIGIVIALVFSGKRNQ